MAYRMVYLRVRCGGYNSGYGKDSGWASDADEAAFRVESRRLFQELGWILHAGHNGVCDTVTKGDQDLYLHPLSFSGVLDEANIQPLLERLSKAQTFSCHHFDLYEEYQDMSDEEYRAALEAKRGEITAFILEQCRTKRSNLYITDPVAVIVAEQFEVCRLCDKDRNNGVGKQFVAELMAQLLQEGRLVSAETDYGEGIRTATAKELGARHRSGEQEQVEGQITMMF